MLRKFFWIVLVVLVVLGVMAWVGSSDFDFMASPNRIGVIEVRGSITNVRSQLNALKRFRKDPNTRAIILRIESPGGGIAASQELYREIKRTRTDKPVLASMGAIAASGGYYIAAPASRIIANPGTITGSIGVIMLTMNARGLLEKVGVEATAVTSGPRKDMGSPFRAMTPEERAIFQGLIDAFYQRFLSVVQEGRPNLQMDQIKKLADGRIYTGEQAKASGLVDDIGYLEDAVELAKKKAGLTEARVIMYRRPGEYSNNVYSKLVAPSPLASLAALDLQSLVRGGTPQFMYLWMP